MSVSLRLQDVSQSPINIKNVWYYHDGPRWVCEHYQITQAGQQHFAKVTQTLPTLGTLLCCKNRSYIHWTSVTKNTLKCFIQMVWRPHITCHYPIIHDSDLTQTIAGRPPKKAKQETCDARIQQSACNLLRESGFARLQKPSSSVHDSFYVAEEKRGQSSVRLHSCAD